MWISQRTPGAERKTLACWDRQETKNGGQFGIIWLATGNLSPRNLEFYSSFRTILGKFRESRKTPLAAWLAKGNPLGPKK